jgi:zinc and cadmium transporter
MSLLAIIFGTLVAGIGSVWIAGLLTYGVLARYTQHLLSLAAGALLGTAFVHLLPEAFESQAGAQALFTTLLAGLIFFFLLDKAELYHHGHEHHHGLGAANAEPATAHVHAAHDEAVHDHAGHGHHAHDHAAHEPPHHDHANHLPGPQAHASTAHSHASHAPQGPHGHDHASGGWAVLLGDSVHCFGDGILIAAAYMADIKLGLAATLAVLVHEIPHHMGDLVVLRQARQSASKAVANLSAAGAVTVLGGIVGYLLVERLHSLLPYLLVIASSSFIYVALADLIPQLQKRLSLRQTAAQVAWLAVGIGLVTLVSGLAHGR